MDIWQAIGQKLNAVTAVTDIVSTRIYHGIYPKSVAVAFPHIVYFAVTESILANGVIVVPQYQITCRAELPETAMQLGDEVAAIFQNMDEAISSFSIIRGTVLNKFLLFEAGTDVFSVPVTIRLVFDSQDN